MKQRSAVRRDHVEDRAALLVARGDVEEAELVCPRLVVSGGGLDRIAGVAEVDEVDALDDAAVFHVEAGDDADLQHDANGLSGCLLPPVAEPAEEDDHRGDGPSANSTRPAGIDR